MDLLNLSTEFAAFMPNRKLLTPYYRPPKDELPPGKPKGVAFDFPALTNMQMSRQSQSFSAPFALWGIFGDVFGAGANGFQVKLRHASVNGAVRHFSRNYLPNNLAVGTAQLQAFLRDTYFVDAGDDISVEVKNLKNDGVATTVRVQVVLWGTEL